MQIRKTYKNVSPELLHVEVKEFVPKQGVIIDKARLETYAVPGDSSSFISRGTLIFKTQGRQSEAEQECLRVHIIGSAMGETKLML